MAVDIFTAQVCDRSSKVYAIKTITGAKTAQEGDTSATKDMNIGNSQINLLDYTYANGKITLTPNQRNKRL